MVTQVKFGDRRIINFYTGIDLTLATSVRIVARSIAGGLPFELDHDIADAVTGHVTHKTTGTLTVGGYTAEVEVEFDSGSTRITFPSDNSLEEFEIIPDADYDGSVGPPPDADTYVADLAGLFGSVTAEQLLDIVEPTVDDMIEAAFATKSSAQSSAGFLRIAGTVPGNVPIVKPNGDGRAGVWEMIHNDTVGYLYHLLMGANSGSGAWLVGVGIDSGQGNGFIFRNKAKGKAVKIEQVATISDALAYGLFVEQNSTIAPGVHLESRVAGAATLLELQAFNATGAEKLLTVADTDGTAGQIASVGGKFSWFRPVHIRDSPVALAPLSYLRIDSSTGVTESNRSTTFYGKTGFYAFGSIGSATQYAPYRMLMAGSTGGIAVAPYITPADHGNPDPAEVTGWVGAFGFRYASGAAQIGFFGATQVSKPTVTGSRGGNAALASLLTALSSLGLLTDSSTA